MSVNLDPIVANKLRQFGRRRMWLIVARGLCAGLVTFLICVSIVAAIDWYWLLSDQLRWGLSLAIYLPVVVIVWMTCLRRMLHLPANEEIASQVELSEPELRENLLSAVELATDDPSVLHDSPVFRSLLQGKVAAQMGRIHVPNLLPVKLVARWIAAAAVLLILALGLLFSGDGRFRQLAARAIFPGANIARVSRIHVTVLQPTPHSLMLAEDETVAVVIEVSGGTVDDATLETFTEKQGAVRQPMRGRTESEFAANIHVLSESVEYRILAGDAVTERFRIESRPRPRVKAFHKTYEYPDYSLLPAETVTDMHGDLLVLEGTKASMRMELDQQVSAAELRIDPENSEEMIVIPLSPDPDSKNGLDWKATVPIDQAAIYKVHLVSKETGFENIFSPKYEIRPQPDLIPRGGFVDQQETTLVLPPNDIVALKAMAEDDLPLVSLEQQVSVNGRDWMGLPLDAKPADGDAKNGRQLSAAWQWDLLSHKLKTGDQVMTRLVATDRKGNVGESVPLRIIIAAADFDPERHTIMERKLELNDDLAAFSALLQEHKTSALVAIERLIKPETNEEQAALDRSSLADLANKQRDQATELLPKIYEVAKVMPPGADAHDLDVTARVITRLQKEYSNVPGYLLKAMPHAVDENRRVADLNELKQAFERTADDATNVAEHYQHLTAYNFLSSAAFDLDALLRQQKLVVDSPTQTWERLLRQETLVTNQLKILERLIRQQRSRLPNYLDGHMNNLLTWSQTQRDRLQESMESEDKLEQLKNVSKDLYRQLQERQRIDVVDGGLPGRIVNAWRDLDNRSGSLFQPMEQLARAVQQENQLAVQAADSPDSAAGKKLLGQAERFAAEVDLKLRRSLDQLPARREITQLRKDSDAQYAADAGLTHRAAMFLLNQHREVPAQDSTIPTSLQEIAPAYRILEAGHEVAILRETLNGLLNMERWDSQSLQSHMDHPRQWDLVQREFELSSQRLREAGVKNEIVGAFDQIRWSAAVRDAGRKISERRWKRDAMIGGGHELTEVRDSLAKMVEDLKPVMAEARAIIAKYSPTIPQMAEQTAEQLRKMEEATTAAADAVEEKDAAEANQPDADQKQAKADTQPDADQKQAKAEMQPDADQKQAKADTQPDADQKQAKADTQPDAEQKQAKADTQPDAEQKQAKADTQPDADLKQATAELDSVAPKPEANAKQQLADLKEQQHEINQQIEDLMAALVEDANSQNVLEESQRERARDADDSIAMIQEPAAEMNRAMEQAQANPQPEAQAKDLAKAAEQQEKTTKALELVAKHFGRLEEGQDVAESRAELRAAERELGVARQMDEQSKAAQELAQMAAQDAQQLMSRLEEELKQNPAMQQALSEISQNTLQEARNALQFAAQDDQTLQQANEGSDADFQAKKRELTEDIRRMAADASRLSGSLVAQANQSAAQGKTPEAQKKFAETQQKLNEAVAKANSAREDQLLPEIAQTAQEAKAALAEAAELLKQGKQQSQTGKDEKIHADDKAIQAAKADAEKRRQQYHEQQKKAAADLAKQADDVKKRMEQAQQAAQNELSKADTRLQEAQAKVDAKPDDNGLKNALQQERIRQAAEQKKLAAATRSVEKAQQTVEQENRRVEAVNNKPLPGLDAQNPSTQLADQLAEEAVRAAEELTQRADQLIAATDFGKELAPTKNQLAASEQQQQLVTQDVSLAGEDVARAARHERRLNNQAAADPLQNAANSIQQVAQNESKGAAEQLKNAVPEAEQAEANAAANPQANPPKPNGQSLQAQQALANSENAIAQQASQLSGVLEPLLAAAEAAALQEEMQAGDPASPPDAAAADQANSGQPPGTPPAGTPATAATDAAAQTPPAGNNPNGNPPAAGPAAAQPAAAPLTVEQIARGQQLARTLDELDRMQAAAAAMAAQPSQPGQTVQPTSAPPSRLDALAQAARAQQATQAASRIQAQQLAAMSLSEGGLQSSDSPGTESGIAEFSVMPVNRADSAKWGKLRSQSAEDLTKGRSEVVSEEYRKSVETYFKVLAERARRKK